MLSLKKYRVDFEGPIEGVKRISLGAIPLLTLKMDQEGYFYECGGYTLSGGKKVDEGIYGHVDEWLMNDELVYEKRCHVGGRCLLMEAAIQILVRESLEAIHCQQMVAEVKLICRRDNGEVTFMMEPFDKHRVIALHDALEHVLNRLEGGFDLDHWFVETLGQLILISSYLEHAISVNHRDLKGDNILINTTPQSSTIIIPLGQYKWRLRYHNEIKLVDFGLACKGTAMDKAGTLSVGEVFSRGETCPKEGRDLYFLLCYFYGISRFREACGLRLLNMIERWIGPGKVLDALRMDGLQKLPWINFLINTTGYSCKSACADILLRDLAVEYPDILRAYK
jgi:serine/threonine protein kinase